MRAPGSHTLPHRDAAPAGCPSALVCESLRHCPYHGTWQCGVDVQSLPPNALFSEWAAQKPRCNAEEVVEGQLGVHPECGPEDGD